MIKFIIHIVKLVITAIVTLFFGACTNKTIVTSTLQQNNTKSLTHKQTAPFTKINISKAIQCRVKQANTYDITLEAPASLQENITTTVIEQELYVTLKNTTRVNTPIYVYITLPTINALTASTAASIEVLEPIQTNNLDIKATEASSIKANITTQKVTVESTTASTIALQGYTSQLTAHAKSASKLLLKQLQAQFVDASCNSASEIEVSPLDNLNATAQSTGIIKYYTIPKNKSIKTQSMGKVVNK